MTDVLDLIERLEGLQQRIIDNCMHGAKHPLLSIPVNRHRDADIIIGEAISALKARESSNG